MLDDKSYNLLLIFVCRVVGANERQCCKINEQFLIESNSNPCSIPLYHTKCTSPSISFSFIHLSSPLFVSLARSFAIMFVQLYRMEIFFIGDSASANVIFPISSSKAHKTRRRKSHFEELQKNRDKKKKTEKDDWWKCSRYYLIYSSSSFSLELYITNIDHDAVE